VATVPPAVPPERAPLAGRQPYHAREVAESFGAEAERYDRTRPSYPDEMVAAIVAGSPGTGVLDVGCGTGIVARQFQAAGCAVLGVDPDARMADFARRRGLDVEVATFEAWDPAGRVFDAVVAGQSWHWVEPVAGAMKAARVLRPGGRLAAFWNVYQPPSEVAQAFAAVYRRVVSDSFAAGRWANTDADPYAMLCDKAADAMRQVGGFDEPERWRFPWTRWYSRDEWLDVVPTQGGHGQFPPETLAGVLAGLGAAIDAMGGGFTMGYTAVVVTARAAPG
jgi:SAM-dependent methyltransferase